MKKVVFRLDFSLESAIIIPVMRDMNKPYYFVQKRGKEEIEITRFEVSHKGLEEAITFADSVDRDVCKLADNGTGLEIVWENPHSSWKKS